MTHDFVVMRFVLMPMALLIVQRNVFHAGSEMSDVHHLCFSSRKQSEMSG